jgi:hypothetical protein
MLEQPARLIVVLLVGGLMLPGCAYMSRSGRQQLAYAHYVKKYSHNRVKQKTKFKKVKVPKPSPQNTVPGNSPQSVTAGSEN